MHRILLLLLLLVPSVLHAQSSYKELYNKGVQYFQAANYPQAINYLSQAIEVDDKDPDAWYNRGVARLMTGDNTAAVQDFKQALKLNPNFSDAWYNLGQAYARLNDPMAVVRAMNEVLLLDDAYADAYAMRGQNYFYVDNYVDGCRDLKSAYELGFDKAESQIKLYCNVPQYFTEVPLTETFEIEWEAAGNWQPVEQQESITRTNATYKGTGDADGLQARQVEMRNLVNIEMAEAQKRLAAKEAGDGKHKLKPIAQGKDGNYNYSLFTLELTESKTTQLWYLYQGERSLYANAIVFSGKKPSKAEIAKWSTFLQGGELIIKQLKKTR